MKKLVLMLLVLLFPVVGLLAVDDVLAQADALHEEEKYIEGFALLEKTLPAASTDREKAEIYWRMAKFQLNITDDLEDEGADSATLLEMFDKGGGFAEKAIELYPSADAYFWHSSNVGRWGETKGILDSLFKAGPMKDDLLKVIEYDPNYADAWYVFGRLYLLLPGWPLSFGNVVSSVSFARRSIDLYEEDELKISYYKSLAEILWKRNWDSRKRDREIKKNESRYNSAKNEHDRQSYFEAYLSPDYIPEYAGKKLKDMSDREEAQIIADWLLAEYAKIPDPDKGDRNNIQEVREMMAEW